MPSSSPALANVQLRGAGAQAGLVAGLLLSLMTTSTALGQAALTATSFTADFSAMAQLKDRAAKVKGKIAVLLPETTTSARYTSFDQPYLRKAFEAAGLTPPLAIGRCTERKGERTLAGEPLSAGGWRHSF